MDIKPKGALSDHLANERTFLAWIRTAIAIMGFGFVVVKFSIFLKQVSAALGATQKTIPSAHSHIIGILLVGLGAAIILFSAIRYKKTAVDLEKGSQYHSTLMISVTTALIFLISVYLLIYLFQSI